MVKTDNQTSLKDAIQTLLHSYKLNGKVYEYQLNNMWPEVAGGLVAKATYELFIKNRVLHLRVNSPIIRQELLMSKSTVIANVNTALKADVIEDIHVS